MGEFILSGSQNFHLQEAISQSLAGRCSTLKLLPLSYREIHGKANHDLFQLCNEPLIGSNDAGSAFEQIFRGGYPPIYDRNINPTNWYAQYTQSYLDNTADRPCLSMSASSLHRNVHTVRCFLRVQLFPAVLSGLTADQWNAEFPLPDPKDLVALESEGVVFKNEQVVDLSVSQMVW